MQLTKPENKLILVSSRGILKSCTVHAPRPVSSSSHLGKYVNISRIKQGDVVYVCSDAIIELKALVEGLKCSIVLVTGDSDNTVPGEGFLDNEDFLKLIENKKIIHWYAQNCIVAHPKLTPIPIGLDYHTMSGKTTSWGQKKSPEQQEQELIKIRNKAKPFWEREPAYCYSNFHFLMTSKYGYDRLDAVKQIPNYLVYYEPGKINRKQSWEKQSQFAFVVSPHGNGYDCHRTWEALCLGCIPIVKSSPIDAIFEGLPVMIVKDWGEVTPLNLRKAVADFRNLELNYNKLNLDYWVKKMYTL